MTKIEWTEKTWNPVVGCSLVSPGCTNCYAMKMAARLANNPATPQYHGTVQPSKNGPVWTGKVGFSESVLIQPLLRKKPTTYFVNSMGDLFHPNVPDEWIDKVFAVIALCPQHTFQVLTKQAERMREYMNGLNRPSRRFNLLLAGRKVGISLQDTKSLDNAISALPLPNVWIGVSAEDQTRADERIPHLLRTPAAIRFVSAEPLLGPITLINRCPHKLMTGKDAKPEHQFYVSLLRGWGAPGHALPGLDWVIVGGESGRKARPMHPDWARGIRDQCVAAGVKFLFKQWGEWGNFTDHPEKTEHRQALIFTASGHVLGAGKGNNGMVSEGWEQNGGAWMARVGKKAAGRLLDGREWNEMPEVV